MTEVGGLACQTAKNRLPSMTQSPKYLVRRIICQIMPSLEIHTQLDLSNFLRPSCGPAHGVLGSHTLSDGADIGV